MPQNPGDAPALLAGINQRGEALGASMRFDEWLERAWLGELSAITWTEARRHAPMHVAYLDFFFRHPRVALSLLDDEIGEVFIELVNESAGEPVRALRDEGVPEAERLACIAAMGAFLCGYLAEETPLHLTDASARLGDGQPHYVQLYMWWDAFALKPDEDSAACHAIDLACIREMEQQLASPHAGVRESGLHGLRDWGVTDYTREIGEALQRDARRLGHR